MPLLVFNIKSFKIGLKLKIKNLKLIKGFTLIELLVVISIIAILMAVATVSYTNAQQKGRDSKRKSDLKAVQQALEIYFNQNGKYPGTTGGLITCTYTSFDVTTKSWGAAFSCDPDGAGSGSPISFMNPLPKDPVFTSTDQYYYDNVTPATYKLSTKLENTNDKEYCVSTGINCVSSGKLPCEPSGGTNKTYCVINP